MLTKETKQILDYLIPTFSSGSSMVDFHSIAKNTGLPELEIESAMRYLESQDYLKLKIYKGGGFVHSLSHKGFHYKDFESTSTLPTSQTNIFNAPISNSAIGNTGTITINNGASFSELRSFIDSQSISATDKAEAIQVVDYVETLTENEAPLKKGFLSKFGDTLSKLDWLPELLGKVLITYFSGL